MAPSATIALLCEIINDENKSEGVSVFVSIVTWYNIYSFQADIRVTEILTRSVSSQSVIPFGEKF